MKKLHLPSVMGLFALCAAHCHATVFTENFTNNPSLNGWRVFGDTNLFQWDSTNQNLAVTWDSSQTNSYFYHPLGTTLDIADDFSVSFDVTLDQVEWNNYPVLAIGLLNIGDATNNGFSRPAGTVPNIFEYDYYPDDGYGAPDVAATLADMTVSETADNDFYFLYDYLPMDLGATYRVTLSHAAFEKGLTATMSDSNGVYTTMPYVYAGPITDFRLDTLSITSYQDSDDPLLAQGTVDNFVVTLPSAGRNCLMTGFNGGTPQFEFGTYPKWNYTLMRSTDLRSWSAAAPTIVGNGEIATLSDTNPPVTRAFYRLRANQ